MRGRKIAVGENSVTLYARHKKTCPDKANNSGTVNCKCVLWVQYKDGKRESTSQWKWTKAEEEARRKIAEREGCGVARGVLEWTVVSRTRPRGTVSATRHPAFFRPVRARVPEWRQLRGDSL